MNKEIPVLEKTPKAGADFRDAVTREQVCLAFAALPTMQGASVVVALVLSFLARNIAPRANVLFWDLMVLAVVCGRIALYYRFKKVREGAFEGRRWKNAYLGFALASGIVWGLSSFMIFPAGDFGLMALFVLVMASLSAATTVSHSSIRFGPAAWIVPAMAFYSVRCALERGEFGYSSSFLIALYMFTVLRYSFIHHKTITSSINLKFENMGLLDELKRKNKNLLRAHAAAREASEAKSRFLAMVSHELRTPLNAIVGFGELAKEQADPGLMAEYLDIIDKSALHLVDLVNDLLDSSRMEAGKLVLAAETFGIRDQLLCLEAVFEHEAARKGVGFSITVDPGVPGLVTGDPMRLRQILSNIIGNALKFTVSGVVSVEVSVRPGADGERREVCFTVRDTGIGMPSEKRQCVFESFAQANPDVTRRYGGSGLGAPIARQLARLMGGDITFESAEGEGSVFYIVIPFAPATVNKETCAKEQREQPARWRRRLAVLVAEDNQFNQRLLVDSLVLRGHSVTLAADGKEALNKFVLMEGNFDLVLLDIMMTEMDGYEAARRIREAEAVLCEQRKPPRLTSFRKISRVPLYAVTANCGETAKKLCTEAGFDGFIEKPVTFAKLDKLMAGLETSSAPSHQASGGAATDRYDSVFDSNLLQSTAASPERMYRYASLVLKDLDRGMDLLERAFSSFDRDGIARAAHALKGATSAVRCPEVSALAGELESFARDGSAAGMGTAFERVRSACDQLREKLRDMGVQE